MCRTSGLWFGPFKPLKGVEARLPQQIADNSTYSSGYFTCQSSFAKPAIGDASDKPGPWTLKGLHRSAQRGRELTKRGWLYLNPKGSKHPTIRHLRKTQLRFLSNPKYPIVRYFGPLGKSYPGYSPFEYYKYTQPLLISTQWEAKAKVGCSSDI